MGDVYAISIHAPPRGATGVISPLSSCVLFQFTPLREGRREDRKKLMNRISISIHAPPRGATATQSTTSRRNVFQFTPLREGRPKEGKEMSGFVISIHAPPRGATQINEFYQQGYRISIHAPPRGATGSRFCGNRHADNFNSRPSARGDGRSLFTCRSAAISIHAPPRGATKDVKLWQQG